MCSCTCSTGGRDAGCQSRGCVFEPPFSQHSFRQLTLVNVTGIIRLPPMNRQFMWKSCQLVWKTAVWSTDVRKPGTHTDRWASHCDMTEKLFNPFPHTTILQQTTLNMFCQKVENLYNWMDNLWRKVENIVAKGEIACFEQFLLLSLCFPKGVWCRGVRKLLYERKG